MLGAHKIVTLVRLASRQSMPLSILTAESLRVLEPNFPWLELRVSVSTEVSWERPVQREFLVR
jgi:hypothetical protein